MRIVQASLRKKLRFLPRKPVTDLKHICTFTNSLFTFPCCLRVGNQTYDRAVLTETVQVTVKKDPNEMESVTRERAVDTLQDSLDDTHGDFVSDSQGACHLVGRE